jgi:hypothetical protein
MPFRGYSQVPVYFLFFYRLDELTRAGPKGRFRMNDILLGRCLGLTIQYSKAALWKELGRRVVVFVNVSGKVPVHSWRTTDHSG